MSDTKHGGYAFPIPPIHHPNGQVEFGTPGMTLRDYFAAKAMQSLIMAYTNTGKQEPEPSYIPEWSYQMADAMLKAREDKP